MTQLRQYQSTIARINKEKGWYDDNRTFGDDIALCHSELSEALEAFRAEGAVDLFFVNGKPEGAVSELADVVIRILDMATRYGFDLDDAITKKISFNASRPYRHGNKVL